MATDDKEGTTSTAGGAIDMAGDGGAIAPDASYASLIARHTANALRRRALLTAGATLVKRDPKDVAGAIALTAPAIPGRAPGNDQGGPHCERPTLMTLLTRLLRSDRRPSCRSAGPQPC